MPPSQDTSAPLRLHYAPVAPTLRSRAWKQLRRAAPFLRRCRRGLWRATPWVLSMAAVFAAARWGRDALRHAEALYWQRRCMAYAAPAEQVAFGDVLITPDSGISLYETFPSTAVHYPECWPAFCAAAGRPLPQPESAAPQNRVTPVLFLGGLRSRGGTERLVAVFPDPGSPWEFWYVVVRPGTAFRAPRFDDWPPVPQPPVGSRPPGYGALREPSIRFSVGQVDPQDPSHFTIRWRSTGWHRSLHWDTITWLGAEGTIHGWLGDDGSLYFDETTDRRHTPPAGPMPGGMAKSYEYIRGTNQYRLKGYEFYRVNPAPPVSGRPAPGRRRTFHPAYPPDQVEVPH
jgi:hypothetical protein